MKALPKWYRNFRKSYPEITAASDALGEAVAAGGPLEERARELVKLGIALGARLEGGVHSHARRARGAGASAEEIRHVGLLAISTLGFPGAMAGLSWIEDVLARDD
jgi:alkylhydroperoxidase/carboxymuconolactone decarboxylase family protein YurZ